MNSKIASYVSFIVLFFLLIAYPWVPRWDWPGYFQFADQRIFFGIPNAMDVLTNLVFITVGFLGLSFILKKNDHLKNPMIRFFILILIWASTLTGIGSAYFHWNPNVTTVFWDRLPMIIIFSTVISFFIFDLYNQRVGLNVFWVLNILGAGSLILWHTGWIDLRPYFILQYGGFLILLVQLCLNPNGKVRKKDFFIVLLLYFIAKIFEIKDLMIFEITSEVVSGHSLKHLFSGLTLAYLLKIFFRYDFHPTTTSQ